MSGYSGSTGLCLTIPLGVFRMVSQVPPDSVLPLRQSQVHVVLTSP